MITYDFLREHFHYNPDTGDFTLIKQITNKSNAKVGAKIGSKVLSRDRYYLSTVILGEHYFLHKLAIFYMTGVYPKDVVDHIDRDSINNKYNNLREATDSQNACNRKVQYNSTTGIKGLYKRDTGIGKGYQVRVMLHGKAYTRFFSIRNYKYNWELTKEAAVTYLRLLRESLHGQYTNHG